MFFGDQRIALLEFLRNLTPQVLLLASALFLATKLDFSRIEVFGDGKGLTFAFLGCVVLWFASFSANLSRFLESALTTTEEMTKWSERIKRSDTTTLRKLGQLVVAAWKYNKAGLLTAAVAVFFAYASMFPVVIMALQGATSLLRVAGAA